MTHATALHASRLPLLAVTMLALALVHALWLASPAAAFVDDAAPEQTTEDTGFEAIGDGFVDSEPADAGGDSHDSDHTETAPVGSVAAGHGGMAPDEGGVGTLHAVAAGLLALVGFGLAAHRRRVPVGSH